MKRKSWLIFTSILLVACLVLSACGSGGAKGQAGEGEGEGESKEAVRIGYIGPLTGDGAPWGISQSNVIKMLAEEINANGGILGRKLEVFYYDNRGDNVETTNVAKRLVQQDKVSAIIGTDASGTSIAMANICEENKVPHLTFGTNENVTTKDGKVRPYTFRMILTNGQLGGIIANYAYNELDIKNVGTLYELGSDYSIGVKDAFEDEFKKLGGTITTSEAYKTGDVDFRAQLSKIKEGNPDAIFLPGLYKQIGLAANQARQLGIEGRFLGTNSWNTKDVLTLAKDSIEGSYFCTAMNVMDPTLDWLKEKYHDKYNQNLEDMGSDGFLAYDAFQVLMDAIERAGSSDSVAVRDALETTKDVEGCICNISMNADSHNPDRDAFIMTIENGDYKFVTRY